MKTIIRTDNAPQPIGPYSQATMTEGGCIFVSGQLGMDTKGNFVSNEIIAQTRQAILNIQAILAEVGCTLNDVVKTTVLMKDLSNFAAMNEVYNEFFAESKPARAAYEVARLPKDGLIEIEAIAMK